jgi:hypothetical protein
MTISFKSPLTQVENPPGNDEQLQRDAFNDAVMEWKANGCIEPPNWTSIRAAELYEERWFAALVPHQRNIVFTQTPLPKVTDVVQIVAPGPGVSEGLKKLNPDLFTIVVNKACELPCHADLWMVQDELAVETEWFKKGIERHFSVACFDPKYIGKHYDTPYLFESGAMLGSPVIYKPKNQLYGDGLRVEYEAIELPVRLFHGFVRGNATITCEAVQLAWMLGAKEIRLCGADMGGTTYYDGTDTGTDLRNDANYGYWETVCRRFNGVVKYFCGKGIKVTSLTETALNVPVI